MNHLFARLHVYAQDRALAVLLLAFSFLGSVGGVSAAILEKISPTPSAYTNNVDFYVMDYSGTGDVTAPVSNVDIFSNTSGCEAADFAGFPAGDIALLLRGTCTFNLKATNAYNAGAAGVLIMNNVDELLAGSLMPSFTLDIPVMGLTQDLGVELRETQGLTMRMEVNEADVIPEPATLALLGLGLAGLGFSRRKR